MLAACGKMEEFLYLHRLEGSTMPNMQVFKGPEHKNRRFRITATGETGSALSSTRGGTSIGRSVTIGPELNVHVTDICDDKTGEIRTFRTEFLEEITE